MADATVYLRILGELGIDTDQIWPNLGHSGRILRKRSGERFPGLYFNRHGQVCYFTLNPRVATAQVDWTLWQEVPASIAVPHFDQDKHNIVPNPGQEQRALRSLLGIPSGGGILNGLKSLFGR